MIYLPFIAQSDPWNLVQQSYIFTWTHFTDMDIILWQISLYTYINICCQKKKDGHYSIDDSPYYNSLWWFYLAAIIRRYYPELSFHFNDPKRENRQSLVMLFQKVDRHEAAGRDTGINSIVHNTGITRIFQYLQYWYRYW